MDDETGLGESVDGVLKEANDGRGLGVCHGGVFKRGEEEADEVV